jgi:glycosyltransferase involved in cell wall biosynthesis
MENVARATDDAGYLMTDRPLVSVITGTWQRHELLWQAMSNVQSQIYPNVEHIIVSDGPDAELAAWFNRDTDFIANHDTQLAPSRFPIRFVELGRNWSSFLAASMSAVPFQVAQWMARGDLLLWCADDDRFEPDHIESLVDLLQSTDSDFVYSRCRVWSVDSTPDDYEEIGTDPPRLGQVTNALYRAELLDYRGFRTHIGSGSDWDQVTGWMEAGARWAMLDRVTMSHRKDKNGEGPDYRSQRQILRGHYAPA